MMKFLRRLRWRDMSIRAKVGLIFGAQSAVIILLGLAAFFALRGVEAETTSVLSVSLTLYERVRNLGVNHQELRELEEAIVSAYYDPVVYSRIDSIAARHQELVQENVLEETEIILGVAANMDPGLRAQVEGLVNVIRHTGESANDALSETQAIIWELGDPGEGRLVELDDRAQALQSLIQMQNDPTLTEAFLQMRQLETEYIVTRRNNARQSLTESIANVESVYQEIPDAQRVNGIDSALGDYEAVLSEISALLGDYNRQFDNADIYLEHMGDAIDNLNDIAGRRFAGGLEVIDRTQLTANLLVFGGAIAALVIGAAITLSFGRNVSLTMMQLIEVTRRVEEGDFSVRAIVRGEDEFNKLAANFNAMAAQLEELITGLERRVLGRTRDLTLTAEISHSIAALRDPKELMDDVVELIRQSFGFYHAQVFLVDPTRQDAELVASTGEAGRALLARKHSLPVGSQSVIGQVTSLGESVIASDTSADPVHRQNELLPDTRSEMALPMRVGERIEGALDVQSVDPNAFTQEDVAVLQIVADQLAIANQNARLFMQTQRALTEIEALNRRLLGQAWLSHTQHLRDEKVSLGYRLEEEDVGPHGDGDATPLLDQAIRTGRLTTATDPGEDGMNLAVPIKVRGEVIGAFGFGGDTLRDPTDDELTLIQAVVDRVGLALENMRLFEETQRAAQREHLVNEITAKIVGSADVNTILQTTVKELGRVLRTPQVSVRLHRESDVDEREKE